MDRRIVRAVVGGSAIAAAAGFGPWQRGAEAQISPGPLSRAHAGVEGSAQCLKCHDAGKGVAPEKCLACHQPLAGRVSSGKGLHARPEYRDCKTCHVEHQGLAYELVWWGKAGRAAFDHRQTGHALEGKHAGLACEQCHKKPRTFLGLDTACRACHADEHRGQFGTRDCLACHTEVGWKPAPGFDHSRTRYPLTGKHAAVACDKCHEAVVADPALPGRSYRSYAGIADKGCISCHQDVHRGRFAADCATCHGTAGWDRYERTRFDHERTAYPLRGRHAALACEKCHVPGRPLTMKHDRCADCHVDAHFGQLALRADHGRCETCHDVSAFAPARFGPEDHAKTAYPLAGAHQAVACNACHRPVTGDALRRIPGLAATAAGRTVQLRFAATRCADCHRDPHLGEVDRYTKKGGCEACHRVESWRQAAFDHSVTRFALAGAHQRAKCAGCHTKVDAGTPRERVRYAALPLECTGCHQDPHQGQLTRAGLASPCERCHTAESWKELRFDHARDSAYVLDGAHARLACAACHRAEARDGARVVRYKPLPTTCKGCHGPAGVPGKDRPS